MKFDGLNILTTTSTTMAAPILVSVSAWANTTIFQCYQNWPNMPYKYQILTLLLIYNCGNGTILPLKLIARVPIILSLLYRDEKFSYSMFIHHIHQSFCTYTYTHTYLIDHVILLFTVVWLFFFRTLLIGSVQLWNSYSSRCILTCAFTITLV